MPEGDHKLRMLLDFEDINDESIVFLAEYNEVQAFLVALEVGTNILSKAAKNKAFGTLAAKSDSNEALIALKGGVDPNMIIKYSTGGNTYNSGTALHKACYDGDMALLECLLGIEGLALGLSDKRQWHAVHFAAWRGNHEALLRLLEDDRVDVNARASPGSSWRLR